MVDGKHYDLPPNPHKIVLPSSGTLNLCFVDLRPVKAPPHAVRSPLLSPLPHSKPEAATQDPVSSLHPSVLDTAKTAEQAHSSAGQNSPGMHPGLPPLPLGLRPKSPSPPSSATTHRASPTNAHSSATTHRASHTNAHSTPRTPTPAQPEEQAAAAVASVASTEAPGAGVAEHRPPSEPVILSEPVLLDAGQMEALLAALQHWPSLDPIKVSLAPLFCERK